MYPLRTTIVLKQGRLGRGSLEMFLAFRAWACHPNSVREHGDQVKALTTNPKLGFTVLVRKV